MNRWVEAIKGPTPSFAFMFKWPGGGQFYTWRGGKRVKSGRSPGRSFQANIESKFALAAVNGAGSCKEGLKSCQR